MNCLSNCENCAHKKDPQGGWCYMFRDEPDGLCRQYKGGYPRYRPQPPRDWRDVLDDGVPLMVETPNAKLTGKPAMTETTRSSELEAGFSECSALLGGDGGK